MSSTNAEIAAPVLTATPHTSATPLYWPVMGAAMSVGAMAWAAQSVRVGLLWSTGLFAIGVAAVALLASAGWIAAAAPERRRASLALWPLAALLAAATLGTLTTLLHLSSYLAVRADILSFSESPFVTDILKFRTGQPIYTDPQDNNTYPYTPGAPILTYLVAAALGMGDSIPGLRLVQFSFVLLAAVIGASVCDHIARLALRPDEYRHRPLWLAFWALLLMLVANDPQFNLYTFSLHNDGLALLVSMVAFWLLVRHALTRERWLLVAMVALPTIGFFIKQNQLLWAGGFGFYLLVTGALPWRKLALFIVATTAVLVVGVGVAILQWGDHFVYWIFDALGNKQVSVARSVRHLLLAGGYAALGLIGGLTLDRGHSRQVGVLWLVWLLAFATQVYTSGIGFQPNHIGPGVVVATCWFFAALPRFWSAASAARPRWRAHGQGLLIGASVLLLLGGFGLIREPRNPVPSDLDRYVTEIEREFDGEQPAQVLLDTGSWVYLPHDIVMKDRSAPVSLHVGSNQPEIGHHALAATIARIEGKTYDKILARQLDTRESWYDFHDRGSGVKHAIFDNYQVVRRIPAVAGAERWVGRHLISEILVLEPKP